MFLCSRVFSQISSIFINNHQLLGFKYNTQPLLTPACTRAPAPPTKYNPDTIVELAGRGVVRGQCLSYGYIEFRTQI